MIVYANEDEIAFSCPCGSSMKVSIDGSPAFCKQCYRMYWFDGKKMQTREPRPAPREPKGDN